MKRLKVWGGFCDGVLHKRTFHAFPQKGYEENGYAIYRTKAEARKNYEDVRPMLLVTAPIESDALSGAGPERGAGTP